MGDACQPGPPTRTPAARGGPPGEQGAGEQPPLVPTLARQGAGPPGTSRRPADPGEPACRMEQGHYHQAAPEPLTREIMRYNKMMIRAPRFGVICHAALGSEGPALLSPSGIAEGWHLSWGLRQALCLFGGGVLAGCGGRAAGTTAFSQPSPPASCRPRVCQARAAGAQVDSHPSLSPWHLAWQLSTAGTGDGGQDGAMGTLGPSCSSGSRGSSPHANSQRAGDPEPSRGAVAEGRAPRPRLPQSCRRAPRAPRRPGGRASVCAGQAWGSGGGNRAPCSPVPPAPNQLPLGLMWKLGNTQAPRQCWVQSRCPRCGRGTSWFAGWRTRGAGGTRGWEGGCTQGSPRSSAEVEFRVLFE